MDWNKGIEHTNGSVAAFDYVMKEGQREEEKKDKRYEEYINLQKGFLKAAQEKNKSIDRLASAMENLASSISESIKRK